MSEKGSPCRSSWRADLLMRWDDMGSSFVREERTIANRNHLVHLPSVRLSADCRPRRPSGSERRLGAEGLSHTTKVKASSPAVSFRMFSRKPSQSDFWRMHGLQHCCTLPRARVEFAPSVWRCELQDFKAG